MRIYRRNFNATKTFLRKVILKKLFMVSLKFNMPIINLLFENRGKPAVPKYVWLLHLMVFQKLNIFKIIR